MPPARRRRASAQQDPENPETTPETTPDTPQENGDDDQETTPETNPEQAPEQTPETTPGQTPTETPAGEADPYQGLSDENHNEFAAQLLEDARTLAQERAQILIRVGKNREALRLVRDTGHLSEKQAKAVELFYPWRGKATDGNTPPAPQVPETQTAAPAEDQTTTTAAS